MAPSFLPNLENNTLPKIKIIDAGFAGYTGHIGIHEFVDGVSVESLSDREAMRLGGIMAFENVETGANPSISQHMLDTAGIVAESEPVLRASSEHNEGDTNKSANGSAAAPVVHTKESLEAIADSKGIKGLRDLAPEGVNAKSIAELIEKILAAQGGVAAPVVS